MGEVKQILELEEFLLNTHNDIPEKVEECGDYFLWLAKAILEKYDIKEK